MSSSWNFLFGILLVIIWVVAGGYVTQANVFLTSYKNQDPDFHRAYWFTFWAAFVTWFLIGLFILLVILSVLGVVALFGSGVGEVGVAAGGAAEGAEGLELAEGSEGIGGFNMMGAQNYANSPDGQNSINTGISWATIGFLVFALILVSITGVLAAIAASSMAESPIYDPSIANLKKSYTNCIIGASMCLGAVGLLIIGIIIYFVVGHQRQQKIDAEKQSFERQQIELPESYQQTLRPNYNEQTLRPNYNEQTLRPNYNEQTLRPNYNEQTLRPESYRQTLRPNYNEQTLRPNYNEQTLRQKAYRRTTHR
jgi:uncharacterized membrane protein